ncbi:MAG: hypothetical protein RLZZ458_2946 [Planctomycetota bacterium]|jgi:uncharacterized protein YqfA (UPF0365 family)
MIKVNAADLMLLGAFEDAGFLQVLLFILMGFFALLMLGFLLMFASVASLWFRAYMSGAGIGPLQLVIMNLKKISPTVIVDSRIAAVQAGLRDNISTNAMESHMLAGGRVPLVVKAMIAAKGARIPLDWNIAAAIDLAGRNVLEAVQTSVRTKVIDCPDPNRSARPTLDGIAKDGIQLKAKARVTVRTNITQLVGGATEETVIARVGEGIVSAIGSCETHKEVLANPMLIAKAVLAKGLDSQTAYEIVSIDIADIDVGDNVGARLQADQAEADMRIARAHAEERRAAAVAHEQEMRALTQENQAEVVLSEAEVPKSMAGAYRRGVLRATGEKT